MRKVQLWSIIKEIGRVIDDWDAETFEEEIRKPEMTFAKYLPSDSEWKTLERYVVRIRISKEEIDEKTNSTNEGTQSVEKG